MSKVDQVVNGLHRILNVSAWGLWLFGMLYVYAMNAPRGAYTYTNYYGLITNVPAKAFDWTGFISGTFIWGWIVFALYLIVISVSTYILKGFRNPVDIKTGHNHNDE